MKIHQYEMNYKLKDELGQFVEGTYFFYLPRKMNERQANWFVNDFIKSSEQHGMYPGCPLQVSITHVRKI